MSELDNIIQITITRETTAVSTASFNIPLILAEVTSFPERVRTYTDIDSLGGDFASTSNVYKMAAKLFGQSYGKPPAVLVGKRQVDSVIGTVSSVTTGQVYSVTIDGTVYSYTAVNGNTAANVVTGLKTAYDLAPKVGITFVNNGDGTFNTAVGVAGTSWAISTSGNIILENDNPTETWVEALEAVTDVNNTWYALVSEVHSTADVQALAQAIEARRKIYVTSTQDPVTPSTGTTDIGSVLDDLDYSRTSTIYHPSADDQFPEAAWVGKILPTIVGSTSWNFKNVTGVTPSVLTDTQRFNLRSKNVNMYTEVGGVNIFQDGKMADNRPMSEIMISDWIYARLQEQIYSRLVNLRKIPFTSRGVAIVENEIRSVLTQAVTNGAIDTFTVQSPDVAAIPFNQKVQGILGVFSFRAILQGEVSKVIIEGVLTY